MHLIFFPTDTSSTTNISSIAAVTCRKEIVPFSFTFFHFLSLSCLFFLFFFVISIVCISWRVLNSDDSKLFNCNEK